MGTSVAFRFEHCKVSASKPTFNQVDLSLRIGLKFTLLTPLLIAKTITYGEYMNGEAPKIDETYEDIPTEYEGYFDVYIYKDAHASNVFQRGIVNIGFPNYELLAPVDYHKYVLDVLTTVTNRYTAVVDDGHTFEAKTRNHNPFYDFLVNTDPQFPYGNVARIRLLDTALSDSDYPIDCIYATAALDGDTVVVKPIVFGEWETATNRPTRVVGSATARRSGTTYTAGLETTTGRIRFRVEPLD